MKRKTALFFYLLGGYVLLQFAWWGYHLIELTQINRIEDKDISRKVLMILSEGLVFFLIILVGLWQIRKSIKKEIRFSERERNFLLSVTHELKTPLASNKLFLQTLLKRELSPEKQRDILDKAIAENSRLEAMIDNILNATKIDHDAFSAHQERFDVSQLLTKIVDRFEKIYQVKNVETSIPSAISVYADPGMVESIVVNLVENALKYAGNTLPIHISLDIYKDSVEIGIADQGPGIDASDRDTIFKKFARLGDEETRNKKGSGLGLFIAKEFAHLNGGDVHYRENPPKGSKFVLTLRK